MQYIYYMYLMFPFHRKTRLVKSVLQDKLQLYPIDNPMIPTPRHAFNTDPQLYPVDNPITLRDSLSVSYLPCITGKYF